MMVFIAVCSSSTTISLSTIKSRSETSRIWKQQCWQCLQYGWWSSGRSISLFFYRQQC